MGVCRKQHIDISKGILDSPFSVFQIAIKDFLRDTVVFPFFQNHTCGLIFIRCIPFNQEKEEFKLVARNILYVKFPFLIIDTFSGTTSFEFLPASTWTRLVPSNFLPTSNAWLLYR